MLGPGKFRFLNRTRELSWPRGWNDPDVDKLWLYNLHYFEDLVSEGAEQRERWHRDLISQWITDNPPAAGNGWEPYPISLRIGYWIKWTLSGHELEQSWLESLALQAEYLSHRVEWHLLGNHVFENARALVLAGLFFEGPRAERWLHKGLRILDRQLEEQVLPDGGHFERSPMYHALVLEGLLDLIQVVEHYGVLTERVPSWRELVDEMNTWLHRLAHPDGNIAFFNDAAFDVALSPAALIGYAEHLSARSLREECSEGAVLLESSGYVRVSRGPFVALLDVAPIGPDYQPGHAHADTLSFELSIFGKRVLVNSGTGVYEAGRERMWQRGTAAHNTVAVDGQNSSEVWSGFRVARRARPFNVFIRGVGDTWVVNGCHDGYRRFSGRVVHRRTWLISESRVVIEDELQGDCERAAAFYYFHPGVDVEFKGVTGQLCLEDGGTIQLRIENGRGELTESFYHPEFGVSVPSFCLKVSPTARKGGVVLEYRGKG